MKETKIGEVTGAQENKQFWDEAYGEWSPAMIQWQEDDEFYLGDQWDDETKAKLLKEKRPVISINKIKKPIDMTVGYYQQNAADIHVFPIEGSDNSAADIYTQVIKWIMLANSNKYNLPYSFKSAVTKGLGWIRVDVRYDEDLINGDVYIRAGNPFHILADPNFREADLSDCGYILNYTFMSKGELKLRFPKMEKEIEGLNEESPTDEYINQPKYKGKKIKVIERWYRVWETRSIAIMPDKTIHEFEEVNGVIDKIKVAAWRMMNPDAKIMEKRVCRINMCTSAGDLVLYDGENPLGVNMFPFIPVFGWYTPDNNDWQYRTQGLVRGLKDLQREKNKRRSQLQSMVQKAPFGGMFYEKGAMDNPNKLVNTTSGYDLIEVNDLNKMKPIQPPQFSEALVNLEQMFSSDMDQTGPNPDLLGTQMSKSEPGMNIQMRQKQGMMSMQDPFENMGFAKRILGKLLIAIINKNFEMEKIQAIVGQEIEIPPDFEERRKTAKYDTAVDEFTDTPSYRMGIYQTLQQMQQQGAQIDPEVMVSFAEIPTSIKETMKPVLEKQRKLQELTLDLQITQTQAQIDQILNPPPPPSAAGGETMLDENGQPIQQPAPAPQEQVPGGDTGQQVSPVDQNTME